MQILSFIFRRNFGFSIVSSDFNCFPQQGGSELYNLLCTRSAAMNDSNAVAKKVFGVPGSWIGWDYDIYKQRSGYSKYDYNRREHV